MCPVFLALKSWTYEIKNILEKKLAKETRKALIKALLYYIQGMHIAQCKWWKKSKEVKKE
jgi:hypothetical protein